MYCRLVISRVPGLEVFMPFALWYHRGMYRKDDPSYWYWKNSANYALDGEVGVYAYMLCCVCIALRPHTAV